MEIAPYRSLLFDTGEYWGFECQSWMAIVQLHNFEIIDFVNEYRQSEIQGENLIYTEEDFDQTKHRVKI
mgnify:CR=1 FL=1